MTSQPLAAHAMPALTELPDPSAWAARIAQAILDTLFGTRPAHHLLHWTDAAVHRTIVTSMATRTPQPGAPRPAVRGIRVSTPAVNVAEASVLVQIGHRYRAAAMRLEGLDHRWLCTAFELI